MTDKIRDRIAAAIYANVIPTPPESVVEQVADAVIRELKLEPQVHYDPDCEFYRYVTDWIDPATGLKVDLP